MLERKLKLIIDRYDFCARETGFVRGLENLEFQKIDFKALKSLEKAYFTLRALRILEFLLKGLLNEIVRKFENGLKRSGKIF